VPTPVEATVRALRPAHPTEDEDRDGTHG
jgi:hypothetical protein